MICLGIETSCDETALALWEDGHLTDAVHTQIPMHAVFGGVVPELASREHLRILDPLLATLLGPRSASSIDLIAVTRGPGLLGALLVGIAYAKSLAVALDVPIVGVNHLHAHLLACDFTDQIAYPALGLLVSGGHTQLYLMPEACQFTLLGKTIDDAAGEAFDKIAKTLNLPYPGGKYIDVLSAHGTVQKHLFTKPYLNNDNLDFSFSGLKTAVAQFVQQRALPPLDYDHFDPHAAPEAIKNLCATVNHTVVETLLEKSRRALDAHAGIKTLCLAGGVAANTLLRHRFSRFAETRGLKFSAPPLSYCGDNAAMVAHTGVLLIRKGLCSSLDFEAIPRGSIVPDDYITTTRSEKWLHK